MKKVILGLAMLMFAVMNSQAMAAAPKVPKSLCLDFDSFSDYHILGIKLSNTVKSADGPVKLFEIVGHAFGLANHPIHGTGYIVPGANTFHSTYTGAGRSGSVNVNRIWEVFFDLSTNTGSIFSHFDFGDGSKFSANGTGITGVACNSLPIAGIVVGEPEPFQGE